MPHEKPRHKAQLSSFDACALVANLQSLIGGRVEKVFHYPATPMEMQLKVDAALGKVELEVKVGSWLYIPGKDYVRPSDSALKLSLFAQTLRKHISGGKIARIVQHAFDRIIEFHLVAGGREYILIFEIFSTGNVVLVQGGKIVAVLTTQVMKDRSLKVGEAYLYPPSRMDLLSMGKDEFAAALKGSGKDLVRALALDMNMGGTYAEEICARAGLQKIAKPQELGDKEVAALYGALSEMVQKCKTGRYAEIVKAGDGSLVGIEPFPMKIYDGLQKTRATTFNEGLAEYHKLASALAGQGGEMSREIDRLKRKLDQQKAAIAEIEAQILAEKKIADSLYEEQPKIERIINSLQQAREAKKLPTAVGLLEQGNMVKGIDVKGWFFEIYVPVEGRQVLVKIDLSKNFHENAGAYYERMKKGRERLEGAKVAFDTTMREIEQASLKASEAPKKRVGQKKCRVFWFEQYRWFISSDGTIVVAGRDAQTNDRVVRKYLRDGDRYAHAEIHGAPSVVALKGDGPVGDATLREACEFALAFSKAWGNRLLHGSAYWVNPEQVSKTPESGEYVPKGGFIIRGKKNFVESDIQAAVGWVEHEGETKLMCGPVSAVQRLAPRYAVLRPGERDKNDVAKELAQWLGSGLEEMQKVLPPGDCEIIQKAGEKTPDGAGENA